MMTPKMRDFLTRASQAEYDKGILVQRYDRWIAGRAVSAGYGWMITAPLPVFIIEDGGRKAIAEGTRV